MKRAWRWAARVVLLMMAAVVVYQFWIFGNVVWWIWFNPSTSAFMETRLEMLQQKNPEAALRHQWVPYERISVHLKRALIAAEDAKFLDHDGFDWEAIQKAYEKNLKKGKVVAGGSTISQQLAKNLFLSGRRTPWRKVEEAMITLMIENVMSKRRIFEIYLNVIEWGNGVFGAEAAARYYYGIGAAYLDPEQSARLAAMVPKPRFYDKVRDTPLLERRIGIILDRMYEVQVP
ncbi:MAG TPA: monofunctional biosynthetic peptidoglycan transglycosylase [Burkholderiales bacterium]|nr:monofunctional biosynthetic peptidoglycan transglycosylase [Burkholderiales bacterium]